MVYHINSSISLKICTTTTQAAVEVDCNTTDFFLVETGVRQGCVLSGLLFIIAVDWIMRTSIKEKRLGIRWNFSTTLEDLDFADDIVLMSSRFNDLQNKTDSLAENAEKIGLQINRSKTKSLRINSRKQDELLLKNEPLEDVNSFIYLGATISAQGGTDEDIENQIIKARNCFRSLNKIWRSSNLELKTKLNLYKSLVKSVLLYGSETWKLTMTQAKKLNVFQNKCLRIIMKVFWPLTITNEALLQKTKLSSIENEIKLRRWRLTGHFLRMDQSEIPLIALTWSPEVRRKRGRPRLTWRRMMERERDEAGWTSWADARAAARDRRAWRERLRAICAPGHEKTR